MSFHFKFIYLWHWSFQAKGEKHFEVVHAQKRKKTALPFTSHVLLACSKKTNHKNKPATATHTLYFLTH